MRGLLFHSIIVHYKFYLIKDFLNLKSRKLYITKVLFFFPQYFLFVALSFKLYSDKSIANEGGEQNHAVVPKNM